MSFISVIRRWRSWIPHRQSQSALVMVALLGSVSAALTLSGFLTALEVRSNLEKRGLENLTQVLTLQKQSYASYLEDLRENTMVAGLDSRVEGSFGELNSSYKALAAPVDKQLLEAQIHRRLITPLFSRRDPRFEGVTAASLMAGTPQGLYLHQAYASPSGLSREDLPQWPGPKATAYDRAYASLHEELYPMLHSFGLYDIFLVNIEGDVIFSVSKEFDLGTNLFSGPYAQTGLAQVFLDLRRSTPVLLDRSVLDQEDLVRISSVSPYLPSQGAPSVFTGFPVYLNGVLQGFLCTQVDFTHFINILDARENWQAIGLGQSGDLLLLDRAGTRVSVPRALIQRRDDALELLEQSNQLTVEQLALVRASPYSSGLLVERGSAVDQVLSGRGGSGVRRNLFGEEVLAAWIPVSPMTSSDHRRSWAMIAEIPLTELYAPLRSLQLRLVINAVLAILSVSLLGLFLCRRLTSPLLRVQQLTRALIAQGFFAPDARSIPGKLRDVSASTPTEVGTLALDLACLQEDLFAGLDAINVTNATVDALSTPISVIKRGVLLLPLIGSLDAQRAQRVRDQSLQAIAHQRARFFIWDLAGFVDVQGGMAPFFGSLCQAARLLGCRSILSGMTPRLAAQLSDDGLILGDALSTASLEDALALTVVGPASQ